MEAPKRHFPKREERVRFGKTEKRETHTAKKKIPQRPSRELHHNRKNKRQKPLPLRVIGVGAFVVILLLVIFGVVRKNGIEVFVGEKSIGILENTSISAEDLKNTVQAQLEEELDTKIKIKETITTVPLHIKNSREKDVGTTDYMIPKIRKAVTYEVAGSAIVVDGSTAAVLANKTEAEEVLKTIQAEYIPKESKVETSFVEKVELQDAFVDSSEIQDKKSVIALLQNTTDSLKKYTVVSNDSWYGIASKMDMTVEKLLSLNGATLQTSLKIGQVLDVYVKKPYVSVKTVETRVMTAIEPKTYEYRTDSTKNKGYQKVIQQGKAGQKESTLQITRINGFVEEEKEVSKKITVKPVPEIILQGSK